MTGYSFDWVKGPGIFRELFLACHQEVELTRVVCEVSTKLAVSNSTKPTGLQRTKSSTVIQLTPLLIIEFHWIYCLHHGTHITECQLAKEASRTAKPTLPTLAEITLKIRQSLHLEKSPDRLITEVPKSASGWQYWSIACGRMKL